MKKKIDNNFEMSRTERPKENLKKEIVLGHVSLICGRYRFVLWKESWHFCIGKKRETCLYLLAIRQIINNCYQTHRVPLSRNIIKTFQRLFAQIFAESCNNSLFVINSRIKESIESNWTTRKKLLALIGYYPTRDTNEQLHYNRILRQFRRL